MPYPVDFHVERPRVMVSRVLAWIVALIAYLALPTDRLPGGGEHPVRFQVDRSGAPTVGSALLRILYAIPSLIMLAILAFVGAIVWVIAVVFVLISESYPGSLWRFLRGIVRWEACLFAAAEGSRRRTWGRAGWRRGAAPTRAWRPLAAGAP